MDILERYITLLESILNDSTTRMKYIYQFFDEVVSESDDVIYNDEIDDLLFNLALELDYYYPDIETRKQDPYYFGEEKLVKIIPPVVTKLKEELNKSKI